MIKSITNFLIIFFIFQQLKSQISQIDQNGYNAFCDEILVSLCLECISNNIYIFINQSNRRDMYRDVHVFPASFLR